MNAVQLIFFRSLLLSKHEQAGVRLEVYRRQLGALASIRNREERALQQVWMTRLIQRETDYLASVKSALGSIDNGTYGFCRDSGLPIGMQRLLINPLQTSLTSDEISRKEQLYGQLLQNVG
ncbi:TraR/DksA family transcriptional regulator [Pseudomonas sp. NA-150]|uniref:TraR/DksA family transcriptional regulator n=1 Tax=Pseudomonas sp. NA-150 TaxID=3367525 RepID=UPI0037C87D68